MQYFMFNLTNPDQVLAGLEIPNVTQIGPYSYRYEVYSLQIPS